ncbi:MAG: ABC transporter ATP-binding protein [Nigerium sp.]|nr:ABC transporter ATP-binding protein [Nigerium sp.]
MPPLIDCTAVTKEFGRLTAVKDVTFSMDRGTVLGFLGPNGAGKSTTIRMLLGLSSPTAGTVRVFGEDPMRRPHVRSRIGYSPGELRLDDRLSVASTLKSWARLRGGVDERFRDELIERLGVQAGRHVRGLSTGNRRKLALAGALMARPELLILDEPTNGLDPLVQNEFMTILGEMTAAGTSVLLSSHILSEVERIADRVLVIRGGVILADGPTALLRRGADQVFRVVFAQTAPPASVFEVLDGCRSVEAPRPNELRVHWTGPPGPLLARLAGHEVESLTAPEPDLETAFMSFYRDEDATHAAASGRGAR